LNQDEDAKGQPDFTEAWLRLDERDLLWLGSLQSIEHVNMSAEPSE
jgi:hypothetical protein